MSLHHYALGMCLFCLPLVPALHLYSRSSCCVLGTLLSALWPVPVGTALQNLLVAGAIKVWLYCGARTAV